MLYQEKPSHCTRREQGDVINPVLAIFCPLLHLLDPGPLIDRNTPALLFCLVAWKKKKIPYALTLFGVDGLLPGAVIWRDVFKDLLCGGKGQQLLAAAPLEY